MGTEYSFSKLAIENGLSNNHVNAIYKDSYGYIWIGTLEGIDRYDGVEIRPYSYRFSGSVENVSSITEDLFKTLWVGTSTGLFRYNQKTDRFERVNIDTKNTPIIALVILPDGNLCVGATDGLYLVNTNSIQSEKLLLSDLSGNQNINVTGIFPDNHGNFWITTSNGLVRYSFQDKKSELFQCKLIPQAAHNSFSSICSVGNKLYLGTTNAGIVEFDLFKKVFYKGVSTDNNIILNIASDKKELIFAGTDGGGLKIINIRTNEIESLVTKENDPESLSSNSVYSFLLDEVGRYWIGTYSAGFCYSKNIKGIFKLHPLTSDYTQINKSIRSFYFSPDGSQYFGTRNGFIQISKDGRFKLFQASSGIKSSLRSNIILSVFPFMGDILIGTYGGGLSRFSVTEQKIIPFLEGNIFSHDNIYAFNIDNSGNLWITSYNGIYRYSAENQSLENFNTKNSDVKNDQIFEITFDSKERIWVGTVSGTYAYNFKGNKLEPIDLSVISDNTFKINYIYEDQVGNIWICTERGGLIMVDPELSRSTVYRTENGLPDNSVCAIIEGSTGIYWISTLKGFCRFSSESNIFKKYTISDGLPGLVFTPAAVYQAPDGMLFFGNEKGLVYFISDNANETAVSSRIIITDFYLSGKEVKPGENSVLEQIIEETHEIRLNDRMNNIGFRFIAMNFFDAADNNYQYKLEGFDSDWKNNGSNNTVFYQNIKPGKYIFKVRNAKESDIDSPNTAEIMIFIHPSLIRSPFFFIFLFLLTIAGVFIMIRYKKMLPYKIRQMIDLLDKFEKYKGSRIPKDLCKLIVSELGRHMEEEKPYLNAELKLADLANHISHPINEISQVLNQDLNQSFSDFVNKYRVEEVKKLMGDKDYKKFTLFAIAQQCGFNSKTSFYRIFKKETGETPADYLKELNSHDR
ncbi:MAG TPA: two-component regulator propeller domain-containing protein [Bacteroidales bacterium]|nr:two-component regulator propeller domain-containing protein [Bacteroidales bacterium]